MCFGGGVPEVRNARAGDCIYAVAVEAVFFIKDAARAHGGWRSVYSDCWRRRSLVSKAWNVKFGAAADGEGENSAKAGLSWSLSRGIDDSRRASPTRH